MVQDRNAMIVGPAVVVTRNGITALIAAVRVSMSCNLQPVGLSDRVSCMLGHIHGVGGGMQDQRRHEGGE